MASFEFLVCRGGGCWGVNNLTKQLNQSCWDEQFVVKLISIRSAGASSAGVERWRWNRFFGLDLKSIFNKF